MAGLIMDGVLMTLLIAAIGYGIKLERKLATLRTGQQAFGEAVSELNAAATRAENAFANLRAAGQETDLLHDRILKARELKAQLEMLMARGGSAVAPRVTAPADAAPVVERDVRAPAVHSAFATASAEAINDEDERARRMAALADRIQGLSAPAGRPSSDSGRDNVAAIVRALSAGRSANQTAQQSLNAARRNLDDDMFAA